MDGVTRRRARHVVSENQRTLAAAEAMCAGDAVALGGLMNESHASLRDDFEVSSEALDTMVACAQVEASCYGARMTGAGFGGCALALVATEAADTFTVRVADAYRAHTGLTPHVVVCTASNGADG